jgi:nicotinamide mononucleotide (NMN) deamidase PncC
MASLYSNLIQVRDGLRTRSDRLVLAESCTAGLVAAELGQIPGISEFLCGSMVVYRTPTKTAWLGISTVLLENPVIGPVSAQITTALAEAILARTPEATVAAAITGHLGPGSPAELDGKVFCAVVRRRDVDSLSKWRGYQLTSPTPVDNEDLLRRSARQREAVGLLLSYLIEFLAH